MMLKQIRSNAVTHNNSSLMAVHPFSYQCFPQFVHSHFYVLLSPCVLAHRSLYCGSYTVNYCTVYSYMWHVAYWPLSPENMYSSYFCIECKIPKRWTTLTAENPTCPRKKSLCRWHRTGLHTDAVRLGRFLKPVSPISDIFEFCRATFSRLLFFQARRLLGSPSIKLASNWSKELFCRRVNYQRQEITTVLETRAKEVNYWRPELLDYWRQELRRWTIIDKS